MKALSLIPISFNISELKPCINEIGFDLHYNGIYKKHVDEYNQGIGDFAFNKAGAELHRIYFENIRSLRQDNKPYGKSEQVINYRYGNFDNFVKTAEEQLERLQGNGWLFMNHSGYINIIPNNRLVKNIALLIDCWEHAYAFTHGIDRSKYLRQHISIINWDIVNKRLLEKDSE